MEYPFIPKSTAHLQSGHFWPIQLDNGRFAAGIVLETDKSRVVFLAGLLNWSSDDPPTAPAISNAEILSAGQLHIKSIASCGGAITGQVEAGCKAVERPYFRFAGARLYHGLTDTGPLPKTSAHLPALTTWGFNVPVILANKHLGTGSQSR